MHIIPESNITSLAWGSWTNDVRNFGNIYYEAQFTDIHDRTSLPRNCGMFCEGPMYNFSLCLALACDLFVVENSYWWKRLILIVTIITTFSTTGYLFLLATVMLYLANVIFKEKGKTLSKKIFLIILFIGGVAGIGIMIHKILTPTGAGSMNVRSDHIMACLKAWISSPVLGVGFQNSDAVLTFAQHQQGMSIGLLFFIATGGLVLSSILFIPYIMMGVAAVKNKRYDAFIFATLFMFLFFTTAVSSYPIVRFFIAYLLVFDPEKELSIKRNIQLNTYIEGIIHKVENKWGNIK